MWCHGKCVVFQHISTVSHSHIDDTHRSSTRWHIRWQSGPGMVGLAPKWVRLAPNGTNPGLFSAGAPNALKSDLKKPRICPIWGQSDPRQTYHPWVRLAFRPPNATNLGHLNSVLDNLEVGWSSQNAMKLNLQSPWFVPFGPIWPDFEATLSSLHRIAAGCHMCPILRFLCGVVWYLSKSGK